MTERTSSCAMIEAPRDAVMGIIADFAGYPEWAGAVRSAEVIEPGPGERARQVRFVLDAGVIRDTMVFVYDWDADARVDWHLAEPTTVLSKLNGSYVLAERDGGTEVTYELSVELRVPMIGMLKRRAEKMIIDTALKGLKKRAESRGDSQ